ncbi:MAG TPA: MFS transporter [Gemmatimonadaceae bacterium]|nr:MFS transporter [Gemmatimonadaceae bacterium]
MTPRTFRVDRNVAAVSIAAFLVTFGEELWKRFVPKYLEALGAPVTAIGAYGTTRDFVDGVYQYPGGYVADHYGRRRALLLFIGLAAIGYLIYAAIPAWPAAFAGLVLIMAWTSMASPVVFAVIGDALPREQRTMGFTVQSVLRRMPIMFAPAVGGAIILRTGVVDGVRIGLAVSFVLAIATVFVVRNVDVKHAVSEQKQNAGTVWREMSVHLKRLLASDILIRVCEGMVDVLLVLYAINVVGVSATQFGMLIGLQVTTSILVYLPGAKFANQLGRKPVVATTFAAFAAFPLLMVAASSFAGLALAFLVAGIREIGEPARKALIVDLAVPHTRARTVGLYYLVRCIAITPAAVIGAILWKGSTVAPFVVASAFGVAGLLVFAATVRESTA